ncbi:hypothetical protein [Streptomyces atratus]|uniref:hypothetical protein n=1 Tax=Streptomyces atratus TaxID=1893 RepID=UPI0022577BCD|nr:hypothetical protein [Streptomyces atratus]MCX5342983.1 hypothetical protein [Streptomyces atratus]
MPEPTQEDHFASAATRHFHDGDYLRKGSRLPSADHLYGFAAECAVKSLLLRFTDVTIGPLEGVVIGVLPGPCAPAGRSRCAGSWSPGTHRTRPCVSALTRTDLPQGVEWIDLARDCAYPEGSSGSLAWEGFRVATDRATHT